MTTEDSSNLRSYAHELVDRMPPERLQALLDLLDEDFFSPEEVAEIQEIRNSKDWTDWREVRDDL